MSWRVWATAIVIALAVPAFAGAEPTHQVADDATPLAERPVVFVTLPCRTSLQSTSSGFVFDDETVVTVAHAIYDSRDFAVRDHRGDWSRPEIVYVDLERDIAVLRVPGLEASPIPVRQGRAGDVVQMVDGAASGTSDGQVLRRVRLTTEVIGDLSQRTARRGYELSVDIKGGDSGAAIVDPDGNLIGMVFARSTRRDASWATAADEVSRAVVKRGVPDWRCERESDVELVLEPLERRDG